MPDGLCGRRHVVQYSVALLLADSGYTVVGRLHDQQPVVLLLAAPFAQVILASLWFCYIGLSAVQLFIS